MGGFCADERSSKCLGESWVGTPSRAPHGGSGDTTGRVFHPHDCPSVRHLRGRSHQSQSRFLLSSNLRGIKMSRHVAQGAAAAGKCKSRAEASSGTADRRGERPQGAGPAPFQFASAQAKPRENESTSRSRGPSSGSPGGYCTDDIMSLEY